MFEFLNSLDWKLEAMMAGRALFATFLGGLVGLERHFHQSAAGVRTFAAVSLGACVFALVSSHIPGADPSRMAANIVVGIGFLGSGVLIHYRDRTFGLTTAATLWVVAAIGTGVGFGMVVLPSLAAFITLGLLVSHHLPSRRWTRPEDDAQGPAPSDDGGPHADTRP